MKRKSAYDKNRKQQLLEDNAKEDVNIKRLAKRLRIRTRCKDGSVNKKHPVWMRKYGFDYLLDFEEELQLESKKERFSSTIDFSQKDRTKENIYGSADANTSVKKTNSGSSESAELPDSNNQLTDSIHATVTDSDLSLRKNIRIWLNKISEASMPRVITALTQQYTLHPRALVRTNLLTEVLILLESSPIISSENFGWLQQDIAACITCLHLMLHADFQHDNLLAHLVEQVLMKLFSLDIEISAGVRASLLIFLSCFFRYGILSHVLIFDILREALCSKNAPALRSASLICKAVGIHLRKADIGCCQDLINAATELLTRCDSTEVDVSCDLEVIIQHLSKKHSKEEFVVRAQRLNKLIRSWTKGISVTEDMCLSISLSDFRNREVNGRWWLTGSARPRSTQPLTDHRKPTDVSSLQTTQECPLTPEVAAAADALGLNNPKKRLLFNVIVSTAGGPDATAAALLRTCSSGVHSASSASCEREIVHIIIHCLMAEDPFNRFYPRLLGALLNHHRRFTMMIKCAFWDLLKQSDLSVKAKANAGRALGLLVSIYDLPLTVIKNFDFGDSSHGNVAFLKNVFVELCSGEYQKVLNKLMQLKAYPRLNRNCRIFIRKHFKDESDSNTGALVLRFADSLRDAESW